MSTDIKNFVWEEKYRPSSLDEFVLNADILEILKQQTLNKKPDNLLLYGPSGTGKTSIAKFLVNHFDADVLYINGSDERGIDVVRDKVRKFASSQSFSEFKVVVYNEADQITPEAQQSLKDIIEEYYENCSFFFTTNNINKMDSAIKSRCICLNIIPESKKDILKHLGKILSKEGVKFEALDLKEVVVRYYPDIRSCVRTLKLHSKNGVFSFSNVKNDNYGEKVIEIIKSVKKDGLPKTYPTLYSLVMSMTHEDCRGLYAFIFDQCNTLYFTEDSIIKAMLVVAEYNRTATLAIDFYVHTIAMIVSLIEIKLNED
jgi:DNA polymerase III delta prime subunit